MVVLERREAAGTRPWLSSEISEEKIIITWVQMSGSASQRQERTQVNTEREQIMSDCTTEDSCYCDGASHTSCNAGGRRAGR